MISVEATLFYSRKIPSWSLSWIRLAQHIYLFLLNVDWSIRVADSLFLQLVWHDSSQYRWKQAEVPDWTRFSFYPMRVCHESPFFFTLSRFSTLTLFLMNHWKKQRLVIPKQWQKDVKFRRVSIQWISRRSPRNGLVTVTRSKCADLERMFLLFADKQREREIHRARTQR